MAFTALHIAKVMYHLNYPAVAWAKTTIEQALNSVSGISSELETEVTNLITELDTCQTSISSYLTNTSGVQVQTDGQVNYPGVPMMEWSKRYADLRSRLCLLTGLSDYSGTSRLRFG